MTSAENAIARSVMYASLFDYPLTLEQLRQTLIRSTLSGAEILSAYAASPALQAAIEHRDGLFFPRGRSALVARRRRREARSRAFIERHRRLLDGVCAMPFVRMVALSGSIAHLNLDGRGDLDLFIVTRGRRVWSVAVAVVVLARLMGLRQTVCANFVLADSRLPLEQQDLFTASQVIHLKPLIGDEVFARLVDANPFVTELYPNFRSAPARLPFRPPTRRDGVKRLLEAVLALPSPLLEWACRRAYGAYLRRRASTWDSPEQVRLDAECVKLHTHSHRRSVLERFDRATASPESTRDTSRSRRFAS